MPKTIKVDALASEIMRLLHEYANDVTSDMKMDIDSVARGTVKRIKEEAPVRHDGRRKNMSQVLTGIAGEVLLMKKIRTEKAG